jgi:TIR domain
MVQVFLSYRRADSRHVTERIYKELCARFQSNNVFKDVDSIPMGTDFRHIIEDAIWRCDIMLVVIGQQWLSITGDSRQRRLDDADDFVRIEIETALDHSVPLIPILVDGATMPGKLELPATVRPMAFRNGAPVRPDPDFHRDMDRIVRAVEALAGTIGRLRDITFEGMRPLVEELLRLHPAGEVVGMIKGRFKREPDPTRRQWLCHAAGLIDFPAALSFLRDVAALRTENELVRDAARKALQNSSNRTH